MSDLNADLIESLGLKEMMWEAYWEGNKQGYGVESVHALHKRAARSQFDRWWRLNHE